jgi:nucleoside-diphosphate-sugar epimerase
LIYANSSSANHGNTRMPSPGHDSIDQPISLYAVTKKPNELMAHVYSHLFGLPITGLRALVHLADLRPTASALGESLGHTSLHRHR